MIPLPGEHFLECSKTDLLHKNLLAYGTQSPPDLNDFILIGSCEKPQSLNKTMNRHRDLVASGVTCALNPHKNNHVI